MNQAVKKNEIHYIHAADLHLDRPFSGLDPGSGIPLERLKDATFTALLRLVRLCLARKPDFLLLAGDLYDSEEQNLRARVMLRDACATLNNADIPVFIAHGNHDALDTRLQSLVWPRDTIIFDAEPGKHVLASDGEPFAVIHGISHATDNDERDLAKLLRRDESLDSCFQLGLLHCNVDQAIPGDSHAPCSLADLKATGLDAFALGHAHLGSRLSQTPFVAYSGPPQSMRADETGPKGCLLVRARHTKNGWRCSSTFQPLAPFQWQTARLNLDKESSMDDLEGSVAAAARAAAEAAYDSSGDFGANGARAVILNLEITGETGAHDRLAQARVMDELRSRAWPFSHKDIEVWPGQINARATSPEDNAIDRERDDILGEVGRVAQELEQEPEKLRDMTKMALAPLAKTAGGALASDTGADLLARAARICERALTGGR